jgi:hypothetical protein
MQIAHRLMPDQNQELSARRHTSGPKESRPVFFEVFFPRSLTGTITHIVVRNLLIMWLEFVVMIIIWNFS